MKKLLALLLLLAMTTLCPTSYGYILVYKMKTTLVGVNNVTGKSVNIPLKGYFIIDPNVPHEANLELLQGRVKVWTKHFVGSSDLVEELGRQNNMPNRTKLEFTRLNQFSLCLLLCHD
jgi:hypothetical protein